MRRFPPFRLLIIAAVSLTALGGPRAADGAVLASSRSGFEGGPALAADGRLVLGERRGDGALRLLAIEPSTHRGSELATFGPLGAATLFPALTVTGTGGIVTATLDRFRQAPAGAHRATPVRLTSRTLQVLPDAGVLERCGAGPRAGVTGLLAAGGATFVATAPDGCAAGGPVQVRVPGARLRLDPGGAVSWLAAAGPMLAWSTRTGHLQVARGATGAVLLRTKVRFTPIALAADGTVVGTGGACTLRVLSPTAPVPLVLRLPRTLCPDASTAAGATALAAGRLVYPSGTGYAVSDLAGHAHPLAGARIKAATPSPVAFDGHTVYVVRRDCDADRLLAIDADVVGTRPPTRPTPSDLCPVRRSGHGTLALTPNGRVRVVLRCPAGCRGTLRLVQRRGRRERFVAQQAFVGTTDLVVLHLRIPPYARALAGCPGGVRLAAVVFPLGEDHHRTGRSRGRAFGSYRIAGHARCASRGGPAYGAPRPGPRP